MRPSERSPRATNKLLDHAIQLRVKRLCVIAPVSTARPSRPSRTYTCHIPGTYLPVFCTVHAFRAATAWTLSREGIESGGETLKVDGANRIEFQNTILRGLIWSDAD